MVLVKRQIPPVQKVFTDGKPLDSIDKVPENKILQFTNQANLAGILTQFTLLSQYANEMFTNLLDEAKLTNERIKSLTSRADNIYSVLPQITKLYEGDNQTLLNKMNNSTVTEFVSSDPETHQHLTEKSRPSSIQHVYDQCFAPPPLELLDPFAEDKKSCLTKYTHPQFFFERWIIEQEKKLQEIKSERKKRREERTAKKNKSQQTTKIVKKMKKIRYDPQTGKRIEDIDDDLEPTTPKRNMIEVGERNEPVSDDIKHEDQEVVNVEETKKKQKKEKRKTRKEDLSTHTEAQSDSQEKGKKNKDKRSHESTPTTPPVDKQDIDVTPSSSTPSQPISQPPPPPPVSNAPTPPPPVSNAPTPPPPPPVSNAPTPPPPPPVSNAPTPPPPPPVSNAPTPPPPPPVSNGSGGSQHNDLLKSIQEGKSLKPVGDIEPKEKPVDTRSNLLESIRAGIKLKSANERQLKEKNETTETKALSVAEILARRVAIEPDSDEELEDDDEWSDY